MSGTPRLCGLASGACLRTNGMVHDLMRRTLRTCRHGTMFAASSMHMRAHRKAPHARRALPSHLLCVPCFPCLPQRHNLHPLNDVGLLVFKGERSSRSHVTAAAATDTCCCYYCL